MSERDVRYDWTVEEARAIHDLPLTELLYRAQAVHRRHHPPDAVQLCTLLSIKTGGCAEDCAYCSQSARRKTHVEPEKLLDVDEVVARAREAREAGATRFCMGAAWRGPKDGVAFERVLEMIRQVKALGLETCMTLGLLTEAQARALREAGLDVYNHNLDTSRAFYDKVITTRSYDDRLRTLQYVRAAGLRVCCGGIIGMGEQVEDRMAMLVELASQRPHPESVPINALVAVPGTPLEDRPPVDPLDLVRMCATARILMPRARVRLSAGRSELSREAQLLCFLAGANSIFYGGKLLTTPNAEQDEDLQMLEAFGMRPLGAREPEATLPAE